MSPTSKETTSDFRDSVDSKPDAEKILTATKHLHEEICDAAKLIGQARTKVETRKIFTKWAYRFGGIALIVIDVTGTIPSAAVSEISIPIGTGIMAWSD